MKKVVNTLFHVNLVVNDWDEMVNFYTNIMGFEQMFVLTKQDANNMFGRPSEPGDELMPWITYLRIAPEQYLELVNAKMQLGPDGKALKTNDGTFHHFALTVKDLDYTAAEMAKAGYPLIYSPIHNTPIPLDELKTRERGPDGCRIAWLVDPQGNPIEVMEQGGQSMQEKFEAEHPFE